MNTNNWPEVWGIIPTFLDPNDPRSAKEQIEANYIGGWRHMAKFAFTPGTNQLKYPGDKPMLPIDSRMFRDELLMIYDSAWVVILQKDGSWEVSRLD